MRIFHDDFHAQLREDKARANVIAANIEAYTDTPEKAQEAIRFLMSLIEHTSEWRSNYILYVYDTPPANVAVPMPEPTPYDIFPSFGLLEDGSKYVVRRKGVSLSGKTPEKKALKKGEEASLDVAPRS